MSITRPGRDSGSRRSGVGAVLVGAVAVVTLLAAGCAGDGARGQDVVGAATSVSAETADQPSAPASADTAAPTTRGVRSTATGPSVKGAPSTSPVTRAPSTTRRSRPPATTSGSTTPKPKPPTTTTKPADTAKLTVSINNIVNAAGEVRVDPGGHRCTSTCSYKFPKGTQVALAVTNAVEVFTAWHVGGPGGGQTTCDGAVSSCTLTLNDDATVTLDFGS